MKLIGSKNKNKFLTNIKNEILPVISKPICGLTKSIDAQIFEDQSPISSQPEHITNIRALAISKCKRGLQFIDVFTSVVRKSTIIKEGV